MAVTLFGKYLRKIRIEHDQLLKTMADALSISSAQLSAMELGNRAIKPDLAYKIADLYHIEDVAELSRLIDMSQPSLKTELSDASDKQRETMVMFARAFTELSDEQLQKVQDITMCNK